GLPLRLPGELSRHRPLDRFNRHLYPKRLNPLPRPCDPPRVRQPSGVRPNLIRHLLLNKLNQPGGLPLPLPGELSRHRPLDRLNPLPRPCDPPRVRQPPPLAAASSLTLARRRLRRTGAESVAKMDLRPQRRAILVLWPRRQAPIRPNRRPA